MSFESLRSSSNTPDGKGLLKSDESGCILVLKSGCHLVSPLEANNTSLKLFLSTASTRVMGKSDPLMEDRPVRKLFLAGVGVGSLALTRKREEAVPPEAPARSTSLMYPPFTWYA